MFSLKCFLKKLAFMRWLWSWWFDSGGLGGSGHGIVLLAVVVIIMVMKLVVVMVMVMLVIVVIVERKVHSGDPWQAKITSLPKAPSYPWDIAGKRLSFFQSLTIFELVWREFCFLWQCLLSQLTPGRTHLLFLLISPVSGFMGNDTQSS